MPIKQQVAIIGADLAAIELAEFLAKRGRQVSIVDRISIIAPEVGVKRRNEHSLRMERLGITLNTEVDIVEITPHGVIIANQNSENHLIKAQTVIIAGEPRADASLYDKLDGKVPEIYQVGDCNGLGLIRGAVEDAMRVACSL